VISYVLAPRYTYKNLVFDWEVWLSTKRDDLDILFLTHAGGEEGTGRRAVLVTVTNDDYLLEIQGRGFRHGHNWISFKLFIPEPHLNRRK